MNKAIYENYTISTFHTMLLNGAMIGLIVLGGLLGRLFGIPDFGLKITPAWPPTGIALAALLLFGHRLLPGIFLGYLTYNSYFLLEVNKPLLTTYSVAIISSFGSAFQAFIACYIIRRLSKKKLFHTIDDAIIFLFLGGALSHLISCTVSVPALALGGYISWDVAWYRWVTFWAGDTLGVYLLTPFLVTWLTENPKEGFQNRSIEIVIWSIIFLLNSYLCFGIGYPFLHFYLLIILWAAFRFGLHGSTLAMLIIGSAGVTATALGYGVFLEWTLSDSLLIIVTFIIIGSVASLIFSSVFLEKEEARKVLQLKTKDLEQTVNNKSMQLREIKEKYDHQSKSSSLESLAVGIAYEINHPLMLIQHLLLKGKETINQLNTLFESKKLFIDQRNAHSLENNIKSLKNCMNKVIENSHIVCSIVHSIMGHYSIHQNYKIYMSSKSVPHLLDLSIKYCIDEDQRKYGDLQLEIEKYYDPILEQFHEISIDMGSIFIHILGNALDAMRKKIGVSGFRPTLKIHAKHCPDAIEVEIFDNGVGIPNQILPHIFQPHFSSKEASRGAGLGLTICYELIVCEYNGMIDIDTRDGEYTRVIVKLPTPIVKRSLKGEQ